MTKPIKILHVTTSLSVNGGVEETLRILCQKLDKKLCKIGICSIQDKPNEIIEEFMQMDVDIFYVNRRGYFFDFITTLKIKKIINKFKANIVHTHKNKGNLHGRIAALLTPNTAIVTTYHDMEGIGFSKNQALKKRNHFVPSDVFDVQPDPIYSILYPFLNTILNCLNSKIITVSNNVRSIYSSDPEDIRFETVYAPYDETIFKPDYKGFMCEKKTIGTVGRLVATKGYIYLLQAMKKLVRYRSDVHLKIAGEGPLRTEIETFIKNYELENNVTLCGNLIHNANLYDGIDIFLQPSISEGCSITLLEAMGVGIPVIASDIDGPKELIIPDKTGILVPPKNPDALKDAIIDFIEDKEKALKIGKAGNRVARENFSSKIFIEKMTRIYQKLSLSK